MSSPEIEVFWRPGCPFCIKLRTVLAARRVSATWRNIWQDDQARMLVASHNHGNEVVPTVRVGDQMLTNPSWRQLKKAIAA